MSLYIKTLTALVGSFFFVSFASAHEVYVLSQEVIDEALISPSVSLWDILLQNLNQFIFWAGIGAALVFFVFFISISRTMERIFDPFLAKLPPYAPVISRITIGLAFLATAYYGALFGPELPFIEIFGIQYAGIAAIFLAVIGLMIIFGFYARIAALGGLLFFGTGILVHGSYMLTYANYAGELLLLFILGAHKFAFHHKKHDERHAPKLLLTLKERLAPFAFPILRVAFGTSLIFASIYAKIIHNQLAIAVAATPLAGHTESLAAVFGFSPEFLVLGAALVEIAIGAFIILGIEIRFTSLFLMFWLSLSLWYFGEVVWPHIILIGIPIAFICYGYDKYSLEGWLFIRNGREPVL